MRYLNSHNKNGEPKKEKESANVDIKYVSNYMYSASITDSCRSACTHV